MTNYIHWVVHENSSESCLDIDCNLYSLKSIIQMLYVAD